MNSEMNRRQGHPQLPRTIQSKLLIAQTIEALKSLLPQLLPLAILGLVLPQFVFSWGFAFKAKGVADGYAALAAAAREGEMAHVLDRLMEILLNFLGSYAAVGLALWTAMVTAYLAMIRLFLGYLSGDFPRHMVPPLKEVVRESLRLALPRGVIATLIASVIVGFAQAFAFAGLVISLLMTMLPVILVAESVGWVKGIRRALTLSYVRGTRSDQGGFVGPWAVFFALMTFGGLFYVGQVGLSLLVEHAGEFDAILVEPKTVWLGLLLRRQVPGMPFTWGFLAIDSIDTLFGSALLVLFAGVTSAIYLVASTKSQIQTSV